MIKPWLKILCVGQAWSMERRRSSVRTCFDLLCIQTDGASGRFPYGVRLPHLQYLFVCLLPTDGDMQLLKERVHVRDRLASRRATMGSVGEGPMLVHVPWV
jgi:hypothetical protein